MPASAYSSLRTSPAPATVQTAAIAAVALARVRNRGAASGGVGWASGAQEAFSARRLSFPATEEDSRNPTAPDRHPAVVTCP